MSQRVTPTPYTAQEVDALFAEKPRLHFIGIGGSGMFPLVQILHSRGYQIAGSDVLRSDIVGYELDMGIRVKVGPQCAENLEDAQLVIYTAALLDDNPELCAAKEKGIPCLERSQVLGYASRVFQNALCVSGTHGKTTVTAMLTQILLEAGCDPGAVIGGRLGVIGGYGRPGSGETCVIEACEFVDTFLQLSPSTALILNIDEDHLDYFQTMERMTQSFQKFARSARDTVLYNADDARTVAAMTDVDRPKRTFGFSDTANYRATDAAPGDRAGWHFTLWKDGAALGTVQLRVPGKHNIYNALAAAAAALEQGVDPESVIRSLGAFAGTGRRFEFLGTVNGADVVDDYAHHPAELTATLTAASEMGYKRVWAVFQPFTYSRTKLLLQDFAQSLQIPEKVILTPIMGGRENDDGSVSSEQLQALVPGSVLLPDFPAIDVYLRQHAQPGDLVITLGCGNINGAAKLLIR